MLHEDVSAAEIGHALEPSLPCIVAVDGEGADGETMSLFRRGEAELAVRHVPVAALRENLKRTMAMLGGLIEDAMATGGSLPLRQVQLSFEVSANGGINLVGTAQVGGKGAITLTFGK
jgi:hypothetical protein